MNLLDSINAIVPGCRVISIVGGGGKTSLLFALASDAREAGRAVLVTTTTRVYDPRDEGRALDGFILDPSWATAGSSLPTATVGRANAGVANGGCVVVAGSGVETGKLVAMHPAVIDACPADWSLVLVEADGARHRPIKAPADHEPVIPSSTDVVCAVIGLDCLGQPLDEAHAFRPELVGRATGLVCGHSMDVHTIARLCAAPLGCFKETPAGASRLLILNKADLVAPEMARMVAESALMAALVDAVIITNLGNQRADHGIRDILVGGCRGSKGNLV